MQLDIKTLSRYRLDRAKEDLEAAKGNYQLEFYKVAINRSYYAIFHAIRAVNIWDGPPFSVILVWKFSRFARNQEESIVYKSMKENLTGTPIS